MASKQTRKRKEKTSMIKAEEKNNDENLLKSVNGSNQFDDSQIEEMSVSLTRLEYVVGDDISSEQVDEGKNSVNTISKLKKIFFSNVFKANYSALSNQPINEIAYHGFLLIEFFQIMFYVFYKITFINEFSNFIQIQTSENTLASQLIIGGSNVTQAATQQSQQSHVNFASYFLFANFPIYTFQQNNVSSFFLVYFILVASFYLLILMLYILSGSIFLDIKSEKLREGMKFLVNLVTAIMILFKSMLQIPFTVALLQGYLCNEDQNIYYSLSALDCGSPYHSPLITISSLTLIFYYAFLLIELRLFVPSNFDSRVPWSQIDRNVQYIECLTKLILSLGFVFDKAGNYLPYVQIACSLFFFFALFQRYKSAIIFQWRVYWATIIYDFIKAGLLMAIAMHTLTGDTMTITTLASLTISLIVITTIVILQLRKKRIVLLKTEQTSKFTNPFQCELYAFRLFEAIQSLKKQDYVILQGVISMHIENCKSPQCQCETLAQKLDNLRDYLKKQVQQKKEQQITIAPQKTHAQDISPKIRNQVIGFDRISSDALHNDTPITQQEQFQSMQFIEGPTMFVLENHQKNKTTEEIDEEILEKFYLSQDKIKKIFNQFIILNVKLSIQKFQSSVDLRILSSYLQYSMLNNYFRAIFDLISCEPLMPSLRQRFIIFKQKLDIQQLQFQAYQRNKPSTGFIDVISVFSYERAFQRFQLQECLTANAAVQFWRELLQKEFNSASFQKRGMDISRRYEKMQEAVAEIQRIYPDDIKFQFRYGKFLINIINNEFEGLEYFKKAQGTYDIKMQMKARTIEQSESAVFGENNGSSIIIISASIQNFGHIIHINEETETFLGYQKDDLIDRNVSSIMSTIEGQHHNAFIRNYLDKGKSVVIDNQRQMIAITKKGYMKLVEVLIKVYPHITNNIIFVGFLQRSDCYSGIEVIDELYKNEEQHLIMTDKYGSITCVTEGLTSEIGLHPKLFHYTQEQSQITKINISSIITTRSGESIQEVLEQEGSQIVKIETRNILETVDVESLTSEELLEIKSYLGSYYANVSLKQYEYTIDQDTSCNLCIYRLILTGQNQGFSQEAAKKGVNNNYQIADSRQLDSGELSLIANHNQQTSQLIQDQLLYEEQEDQSSFNASMSVGSSQSQASAVDTLIKNFKKTMGERRTPKNLGILNKFLIGIVLVTILLQSVDFAYQIQKIDLIRHDSTYNFYLNQRYAQVVLLSSYLMSYLNIAAGQLGVYYPIIVLNYYEPRFSYDSRVIQEQTAVLQQIQNYLISSTNSSTYQNDGLQTLYELQEVPMYMVDGNNNVILINQTFRTAMELFLDTVLILNGTTIANDNMPLSLLMTEPTLALNMKFSQYNVSKYMKAGYYVMVNSIRSLRTFSLNATNYHLQLSQQNMTLLPFLIILIVAVVFMFCSLIAVLYLIKMNERIQEDILSLYAQLQVHSIVEVYNKCNNYIHELKDGSLFSNTNNEQDTRTHVSSLKGSTLIGGQLVNRKRVRFDHTQDEQLSEEEKEEIDNQKQILMKRRKRFEQKNKGTDLKTNDQCNLALYSNMANKASKEVQQIVQQYDKKNVIPINKSMKSTMTNNSSAPKILINNSAFNHTTSQQKRKKGNKMVKKAFKIEKAEAALKQKNALPEDSARESESRENEDSQSDYEHKRKAKNHNQDNKQENDEDNEDQLQMKVQRSFKTQNTGRKLGSLFLGILITSYFFIAYFFQSNFINQNVQILNTIPLIMNRFTELTLQRVLQRDRAFYNNSLVSFEYDPVLGYAADVKEYQLSIQNEGFISQLKINHPPVVQPLVDYLYLMDSSQFCNAIIGQPTSAQSPSTSSTDITKLNVSGFNSYQSELNTVIAACRAAFSGDIQTLQRLHEQGVNLNGGDYDYRTPLYYAVRGNQSASVQTLLSLGVSVNSIDRWKGTPLNYAAKNSSIYSQLKSSGAILGTNQTISKALPFSLIDINERLYYATFYNDMTTAQVLSNLGWNLNALDIDGRTVLHIAASQNFQDMIEYFISMGADPTIHDSRSHDPMTDASNFGFGSLSIYIASVIVNTITVQQCSTFNNGLLDQGIGSALGQFQRAFQELYIETQTAPNYAQMLLNLKGKYISNGITYTDPIAQLITYQFTPGQILAAFQELYLFRILQSIYSVITNANTAFFNNYEQITQIVFIIYIILQMSILLIFRRLIMARLRDDIIESRGILNLIPNHIIYQNKEAMEAIIKKLQN